MQSQSDVYLQVSVPCILMLIAWICCLVTEGVHAGGASVEVWQGSAQVRFSSVRWTICDACV